MSQSVDLVFLTWGEGGRSGRIPVSGCNKLRCLNMIITIIKIFMINCHNQLSWIIIVIIIIIMTNYHGYQDFQWALKSRLSVNMIISQSQEPEHDFHTYHNYHDKPIWFLIFQHKKIMITMTGVRTLSSWLWVHQPSAAILGSREKHVDLGDSVRENYDKDDLF